MTEPVKEKDKVQELEDLIKGFVVDNNRVKELYETKLEEVTKQIEAFKELAKKQFPIPQPEVDKGATPDEAKEIFAPFDMAKQGLRLCDPNWHPKYHMTEEKRQMVAEYLVLFLKAAVHGDARAVDEMSKRFGISPEAKTVVGDTGNQFPIPDIVMAEILAFAREASVILQYSRIWDMTSEKMSFPRETAGVSVNWGNTTQESEPTVEEFELDCEELSAYAAVRNHTLADTRSDIVSWLAETMAEACGLELDDKGFNGLGTDSPFICSGILSSACGYSVVMASGSTAFSNLTSDHLSEMISKLDGLKKRGAKYWMHGQILHTVRTLKDSQNRPIWLETLGSAIPGTIWGYPYIECIKMPSTSAANTAFLAFGNMRYMAVGRRLESYALSVDPYGLWTTNRTRWKIYQRWALGMNLPNGFVRMLTASA